MQKVEYYLFEATDGEEKILKAISPAPDNPKSPLQRRPPHGGTTTATAISTCTFPTSFAGTVGNSTKTPCSETTETGAFRK